MLLPVAGSLSPLMLPRRYYDPVAALFAGTDQYLSVASNAALVLGGAVAGSGLGDFTVAGWAKQNGTTGIQTVLWKGNTTASLSEYGVRFLSGGANLQATVGNGTTSFSANSSAITAQAIVFFVMRYDSTTGKIGISVNNGAFTETTVTGTPVASTNVLAFGRLGSGALQFLNGWIDGVGIWKRLLTGGEITSLYNSGRGLLLINMSALTTSHTAHWELDELTSTNRVDGIGSSTLVPFGTGGVTSTTGIVGS